MFTFGGKWIKGSVCFPLHAPTIMISFRMLSPVLLTNLSISLVPWYSESSASRYSFGYGRMPPPTWHQSQPCHLPGGLCRDAYSWVSGSERGSPWAHERFNFFVTSVGDLDDFFYESFVWDLTSFLTSQYMLAGSPLMWEGQFCKQCHSSAIFEETVLGV